MWKVYKLQTTDNRRILIRLTPDNNSVYLLVLLSIFLATPVFTTEKTLLNIEKIRPHMYMKAYI